MGVRARSPFRCGACGKPRGITHLCNPGRRRKRRPSVQSPLEWTCPTCGRKRGLVHDCHQRTDFKSRKRQQATAERRRKRKAVRDRQAARRKQAAAGRRAREKARRAAARKRKSAPRRTGDRHEPGSCGDRDCPKYGCVAYWRGMEDCPGPHGREPGKAGDRKGA